MSRHTDSPAIVYPTEKDSDAKKNRKIISDLNASPANFARHYSFIVDEREQGMENAIETTKQLRSNEPAFVVMGGIHTFKNCFRKNDSSAFYRRIGGSFDWRIPNSYKT